MKRKLYGIALLAAVVQVVALLVMGVGFSMPSDITTLQPSMPPMPLADVLKPIQQAPEMMLSFFSADTFLFFAAFVVYAGLYTIVAESSQLLAGLGLGIGLLSVLLDFIENGMLVVYAQQSIAAANAISPALPFLFVVANLKMIFSYSAFMIFGVGWPRDRAAGWVVSSLMILYPILGGFSITVPAMQAVGGVVLLLIAMSLIWYFAGERKRIPQHAG